MRSLEFSDWKTMPSTTTKILAFSPGTCSSFIVLAYLLCLGWKWHSPRTPDLRKLSATSIHFYDSSWLRKYKLYSTKYLQCLYPTRVLSFIKCFPTSNKWSYFCTFAVMYNVYLFAYEPLPLYPWDESHSSIHNISLMWFRILLMVFFFSEDFYDIVQQLTFLGTMTNFVMAAIPTSWIVHKIVFHLHLFRNNLR